MAAFGDRRAADVTSREVSAFLRALDREGLSARNVNKHRQVLAAIFAYACRPDVFDLPGNPVTATDKRRENPPPALDYYEVDEVEALARCCEHGEHRVGRAILDPDELAARAAEDRQDAEAFRLLFYTGLRLGELLALRWADVNLPDRLFARPTQSVRRSGDASQGSQAPLRSALQSASAALARLASRDDCLQPDDGVLVNRFGRHLEGSALRRRYERACAAAGLRPVRLHGLRHAAGSLIARTSDPVFVRDFLGHAKLSTTDRYLSAKLRPEELKRLDDAFAPVPVPDGAESGLGSH